MHRPNHRHLLRMGRNLLHKALNSRNLPCYPSSALRLQRLSGRQPLQVKGTFAFFNLSPLSKVIVRTPGKPAWTQFRMAVIEGITPNKHPQIPQNRHRLSNFAKTCILPNHSIISHTATVGRLCSTFCAKNKQFKFHDLHDLRQPDFRKIRLAGNQSGPAEFQPGADPTT
mgnify:CR=1 FL=1